jgi:hypothetical protein
MTDYDLRGKEPEQVFALEPLPDECIDAANRTAAMYDPSFPGWALYSRIVRGDKVFDRQLAAWAIRSARIYSRAKKVNGRRVIRPKTRGRWIAQAGIDALELVIRCGETRQVMHHAQSALSAEKLFGIEHRIYAKFRGDLAAMMMVGFHGYVNTLHWQLSCVTTDYRRVA